MKIGIKTGQAVETDSDVNKNADIFAVWTCRRRSYTSNESAPSPGYRTIIGL